MTVGEEGVREMVAGSVISGNVHVVYLGPLHNV